MQISTTSCYLFLSTALLASTGFFVEGNAGGPCLGDCTGTVEDGNKVCHFNVKVNLFAGELGYFSMDQCGEEANPTLGIEKGATYYFSQKDESNYYHPLGLAYYPDGAHDDVDELEPGIAPPGSSSSCADESLCPAPMYKLDDDYLGVYSNNNDVISITGDVDFGLDVYEPQFFAGALDWTVAGDYSVALKFDVNDFDDDIFYFCHIHQFMTGRMKFVDATGHVPDSGKEDLPEIPYNYDETSDYDGECGTHNLDMFQLPHPECPSKFVCNKPDVETAVGKFADCIDSMNCAMTVGMTTNVNMKDAKALFIHQMIPHHQNAVNMCKALMKQGEIECADISDESDTNCVMRALCYEIITVQNHQIQIMRGVLEGEKYDDEDDSR